MTERNSYALNLYSDDLAAVIAKAIAEMQGSAAKFSAQIRQSVTSGNFISNHQITKPGEARKFTIGELCATKANEDLHQAIDPEAVSKILFGPDGLIKKSGGGRFPYLMDDIEVAYVYDAFNGSNEGPWITSGRNRTMALQIMLRAAGMSPDAISNLQVRVSVVQCKTRDEVQRRIINANTGSRNFSRAETRERMGSTSGVQFFSCESILETVQFGNNQDTYKAAFGSYLRQAAESLGLNSMSPSQYSDAGNSLWNKLKREYPKNEEFKTFYAWVKADSARFGACCKAAESSLAGAVALVAQQKSAGAKSSKLAAALAPAVIQAAGF